MTPPLATATEPSRDERTGAVALLYASVGAALLLLPVPPAVHASLSAWAAVPLQLAGLMLALRGAAAAPDDAQRRTLRALAWWFALMAASALATQAALAPIVAGRSAWADAFALAAVAPMVAAILAAGGRPAPALPASARVDVVAVVACAAATGWAAVHGPAFESNVDARAAALAWAHPLCEVAIVLLAVRFLLAQPADDRRHALGIPLALAFACAAVGDLFDAGARLGVTFIVGAPGDAFALMASALVVVAMLRLDVPSPAGRGRREPPEIAPALAVIGPALVLFVRPTGTSASHWLQGIALLGACAALLLWRHFMTLRRELSRYGDEQAEEGGRRVARLIDAADAALLIVDRSRRLRFASAAAQRLLGVDGRGAPGAPLERLAPAVAAQARRDFEAFARPGVTVVRNEWTWSGPSGDANLLAVRIVDHLDEPGIGGYVCHLTDIRDERRMESALRQRALRDPLTGLGNRALLLDRLALALGSAPHGCAVALALIDLDHFKLVNDGYGHAFGDRLLRQVALRLADVVRAGDSVARLGGDEFAVLLVGELQDGQVARVADRIMRAFDRPFRVDDEEIDIRCSCGIALADPGDRPGDLLRHADIALYRAKSMGRACHAFYEPRLQAFLARRLSLRAQLRRVLQTGGFSLCFQPAVHVADGTVRHVEALLRWNDGDGAACGGEELIRTASDTGLMVEIGDWVLRAATREFARRFGTLPDLLLSINLSPVELMERGLPGRVRSALEAAGLPAARVQMEVREQALTLGAEAARALAELRAVGVRLALDDFGSSSAALETLASWPLGEVKFSSAFLRAATVERRARTMFTAAVDLCRVLGLAVCAKGVETAEHRQLVSEAHLDAAQGFAYVPPLEASDCARWIARHGRAAAPAPEAS